jgi:hypothetical protein
VRAVADALAPGDENQREIARLMRERLTRREQE